MNFKESRVYKVWGYKMGGICHYMGDPSFIINYEVEDYREVPVWMTSDTTGYIFTFGTLKPVFIDYQARIVDVYIDDGMIDHEEFFDSFAKWMDNKVEKQLLA